MKKNIVITGASGLVATELTCLLLSSEGSCKVYAVSTHPDKLSERYKNEADIVCLSQNDLCAQDGLTIDAVVHCAFARNKDAGEIAKSIQYTSKVLSLVKRTKPSVFINISSQSVYGQTNPPLWTEQTSPAPDYLYALGKYATEELTTMALAETDIKYTNIRLSSVCENVRFLNVFAKNALSGQPITVMGGTQSCSFIDVRDVAEALKCVIGKALDVELQPVYNLGIGKTRTIAELAEDTRRIAKEELGLEVQVTVQPSDIRLDVGMDASLFCKTFGWAPKYGYDDMIRSLLALNKEPSTGVGGYIPISFKIVYSER